MRLRSLQLRKWCSECSILVEYSPTRMESVADRRPAGFSVGIRGVISPLRSFDHDFRRSRLRRKRVLHLSSCIHCMHGGPAWQLTINGERLRNRILRTCAGDRGFLLLLNRICCQRHAHNLFELSGGLRRFWRLHHAV